MQRMRSCVIGSALSGASRRSTICMCFAKLWPLSTADHANRERSSVRDAENIDTQTEITIQSKNRIHCHVIAHDYF